MLTNDAEELVNTPIEEIIIDEESNKEQLTHVIYKVDEIPPIASCIFLGLQHYLSMFVATLSIPIVLTPCLCLTGDVVGQAKLIGTLFFTCGIITTIQVFFGVRLPIVQAGTFALLSPTLAYFNLPEMKCPPLVQSLNFTNNSLNSTELQPIIIGSSEHKKLWHGRLVEVQGSLMVVSCVEIIFGLTGFIGWILKYIGPLSISPTITLLGISLFSAAAKYGSQHWPTCLLTIGLILIFSLYLSPYGIPCPTYSLKNSISTRSCNFTKVKIFTMFPILLAICFSWFICWILTVSNVMPENVRTDAKIHVIRDSPWIRIPYPFQWGLPVVKLPLLFGLFAGILATTIESIGDYTACAYLAGAPKPTPSAMNRGILVEGLGSLFDGILGTGNGTTSTSINVGVVGLTRIGSRYVVIVAACFMSGLGIFCKFGAIFVTIPEPVIGGAFFMIFGMIVAVGISTLKSIDLNSSRNLTIFGFSFFMGLTISEWIKAHPNAIKTGSTTADAAITVLLSTSMFLGGFIGFILDNTVPAKNQTERGLNKQKLKNISFLKIYDLPWNIGKSKFFRYCPICPVYDEQNKCTIQDDSHNVTFNSNKDTIHINQI